MRVLVYAHRLEIGGTQTNAIELAAAVRDATGDEVTLFAAPGPAAQLAVDRGVPLLEAPRAERHPSRAPVAALRSAVRATGAELVHAWDWPQCLDALVAVHASARIPFLCTAMGMEIPRFLPRWVPTTFGTPALRAEALARGHRSLLLEPPVDTVANRPGVVDGGAFREHHGIDPGSVLVVTVSRLTQWLKLESLRRTIDAVDELDARGVELQLAIVGEGPERAQLARRAEHVNDHLGRQAVVVVGPMLDPRPAYEAADIVVGMGGSALRGMAFARPVVVVGERGFSRPFDHDSAPSFVHGGYYGIGAAGAPSPLAGQLADLAADPAQRVELGSFSRRVVEHRYALDATAAHLAAHYARAAARPVPRAVALADVVRSTGLRLGDVIAPDVLRHPIRATARA